MAYTYRLIIGAPLAFTLHILIATSFPVTTTDHTVIPKSTKLALRLIHRHSISSQYYSKEKISGRYSLPPDDGIRAPVLPMEDSSLFLVNISIGEPPVPQLLAMDTGSDLIWVRCTPCDGCNNIFDPKKSSTYSELSSHSPECTDFVYGHDQDQEYDSQCPYWITYADNSYSSGVLALEKFTFLTSTGGTIQVPDAVLGCATETDPHDLKGILGLEAPSEYHFVARTGNRFSYCIGNISDTQYMYNQLILGDGAIIQGDSTPMQTKDGHYVVSLEGISVGEKQLTINQQEFRYNVIIDSGTTFTKLLESAYQLLVAEVKNLIDGVLTPAKVRNADENQLCYKGNLERDLKGFPIVTLHLAEGADIDLDVESIFKRTRDGLAFCMAIVESNENMIGIMAQQYYNVGFDLDAKRVSLQRIDCELLED